MADWNGAARTNGVRLADGVTVDDLRRRLDALCAAVLIQADARNGNANGEQIVAFFPATDDGGFPSWLSPNDTPEVREMLQLGEGEEFPQEVEFDWAEQVMPLIQAGDVLTVMESGHERLRSITGRADAYMRTSDGQVHMVAVDISDIEVIARETFAQILAGGQREQAPSDPAFEFQAQHPLVADVLDAGVRVLGAIPAGRERTRLENALRVFETFAVPGVVEAQDITQVDESFAVMSVDEQRQVLRRFVDDYDYPESERTYLRIQAERVREDRRPGRSHLKATLPDGQMRMVPVETVEQYIAEEGVCSETPVREAVNAVLGRPLDAPLEVDASCHYDPEGQPIGADGFIEAEQPKAARPRG
jgi:hypothetical protein